VTQSSVAAHLQCIHPFLIIYLSSRSLNVARLVTLEIHGRIRIDQVETAFLLNWRPGVAFSGILQRRARLKRRCLSHSWPSCEDGREKDIARRLRIRRSFLLDHRVRNSPRAHDSGV
jgi:hypothetical protein